jgi:hypothetical protein
MSGPAAAITNSRGVGLTVLGLTMCGDLVLRGGLNYRRKRRRREPLWFFVPSIGGHYGLIPTWVWGGLAVFIGVGMTVNEVLAYRENQVNQQAYEQRLAEEARKKLEKPVDNLPKKTGFELDLRQDGKKYWVVMTNHHTEVVHQTDRPLSYRQCPLRGAAPDDPNLGPGRTTHIGQMGRGQPQHRLDRGFWGRREPAPPARRDQDAVAAWHRPRSLNRGRRAVACKPLPLLIRWNLLHGSSGPR